MLDKHVQSIPERYTRKVWPGCTPRVIRLHNSITGTTVCRLFSGQDFDSELIEVVW